MFRFHSVSAYVPEYLRIFLDLLRLFYYTFCSYPFYLYLVNVRMKSYHISQSFHPHGDDIEISKDFTYFSIVVQNKGGMSQPFGGLLAVYGLARHKYMALSIPVKYDQYPDL